MARADANCVREQASTSTASASGAPAAVAFVPLACRQYVLYSHHAQLTSAASAACSPYATALS